jgi:hypothetical protein
MAAPQHARRAFASGLRSGLALVCALAPALAQAPCAPSGNASAPRDPLRFAPTCGQSEPYVAEPLSSRIWFTPCAQELEIRVRTSAGERVERDIPLAPLLPQWVATVFTQLSPGEILVAGHDFERDRGVVLRLVFDLATWELVATHEELASRVLLAPVSLARLPCGKRVAVLDRGAGALHVLDLERRRLDLVHRGPTVRDMKDVSAERLDTGGVKLWLTSCDASTAYHVPPTLLGPTISLYDWDGDGTFESASPSAGRPASPTGPVPAARRAARVRR